MADATDPIPLRIAGVPEHFNLPWMLALERRAFVRAKIELKWHTVPEGTGRMCAMLRNAELDLAVLVTEGAVRDILHGNPARILAPYVDTPLTWGVHVGAGSGIEGPAQLGNVPYAISRPNSGSHLAAMAYSKAQGRVLAEKDLVVVNDLHGAVAHLNEYPATAFLWEKYTTKALVDAGVLKRVGEHRSSWPSFVIVGSEATLAEHRGPMQRMLKVIRDQAFGVMCKKTAPEMIAQRYAMGLEDARAWLAEVRWNTGQAIDGRTLATVVEALRTTGRHEEKPSPQELEKRLLWATPKG